jgi:1-acyl-sn-glycerol-3-phosphate acyltransferase
MSRESTSAPEPSVPKPRVEKTWVYRCVRRSTDLFFRLYFRRRIERAERLPRRGGVLLVANHQSFLDIPFVAMSTDRHVCFVARDTLARSRPLAWLMRQCGAVLVKRGAPDRAALREMVAHLEHGDVVVVFAEGTRTPDGRVQPFKQGAALAARLAGAPIAPAGIRGAFEAWPRHARLPRPRRIAIRYGDPIDSAAPDALDQARAAIEAMVGDGRYAGVAGQD